MCGWRTDSPLAIVIIVPHPVPVENGAMKTESANHYSLHSASDNI